MFKTIWDKVKWIVGAVTLIGIIYSGGSQIASVVSAAGDVPDLKQSVGKLTEIVDELRGANYNLYRHLRGMGLTDKRAKDIAKLPLGEQKDEDGNVKTLETYLSPDSLYVRGLLLMTKEDGTVDTLKELYRFDKKKE